MECLILSAGAARPLQWQLEDLGAEWRCLVSAEAEQAHALMRSRPVELLILTPCRESAALLEMLRAQPLLSPPWVLGDGLPAPDGPMPGAAELPGLLTAWRRLQRLPALAALRLPEATRLARGLLRALGVPQSLRAWDYLPDMAALTAVHPPLLTDLSHGLYPLTARRHQTTASAVERSLRLAVEATWNRGDLTALERFFGSSVDPDRGKPTNREFLCRVQERVTLAARRLGAEGGKS